MAEDIMIRAEGLGKKYVIGHQAAERMPNLRDAMARAAHNFARTTRDLLRGKPLIAGDEVEEFWALRDVDFEIRRGDVVGVIGRNGAGKSTLLKVLSRITEPSEGRVEIRGRVASLLEVGTGFHPELTGRENIYLNGAILGMSRGEIRHKFDEIVAFAEIEKFLDTPVKRYSSGMYVRLAFAVAAHLEPEILIVDEVLAVGDAEFQKKCLGKMKDVAGKGRTVLFVSHNMAAVRDLCTTALYLLAGTVAAQGEVGPILSTYLSRGLDKARLDRERPIGENLILKSAELESDDLVSCGSQTIRFDFAAQSPGSVRECTLNFYSQLGARIGIVDPREGRSVPFRFDAGEFSIRVVIESLPLVEGDYSIGLWIVTNDFQGLIEDAVLLSVAGNAQNLDFASYPPELRGYVALKASTSVVRNTLVSREAKI